MKTILLIVMFLLIVDIAFAREQYPEQFFNEPQSTKDYFNNLKSPKGLDCCKIADCEPTDQWSTKGNNYVAYLSKWNKWVIVPPDTIVTDPKTIKDNPYAGEAIVCYNKATDDDTIYCFLPGAGI